MEADPAVAATGGIESTRAEGLLALFIYFFERTLLALIGCVLVWSWEMNVGRRWALRLDATG